MTDEQVQLSELPEFSEPVIPVSDLVEGRGLPFQADGHTFYLRQPTDVERDDADLKHRIAQVLLTQREDIIALAALPPSREDIGALKHLASAMEAALSQETDPYRVKYWNDRINAIYDVMAKRTAADPIVEEAGRIARNRFLARKLICGEDGRPINYDTLPPKVQDEAAAQVDRLLVEIRLIPFA